MTITFTPDQNELRNISELPTELALPPAAFLANLANAPDFVESQILPLVEGAKGREDWCVARRHNGEDGSYSLKVFVWPAGTGTKIHDHSSWGAYACASGAELEERYERLDGSRAEHVRREEVLAIVVEPRGRRLDGHAGRRGHPPGREPWREHGDLRPPLRPPARGGRRSRLRSLPRPRLRPAVIGATR